MMRATLAARSILNDNGGCTMEKYINAELEIIEFDSEDVITTSLIDGGDADDVGSGSNINF